MRKTLSALVLSAVTLVVVAGCSSKDPAGFVDGSPAPSGAAAAESRAPEPEPGKPLPEATNSTAVAALGQLIEITDPTGVNNVSYSVKDARRYDAAPAAPATKPKKGTFLSVTATVKVIAGKGAACPCDFVLVAADHKEYKAAAVTGFDKLLKKVSLKAGQQAQGLIVFDVPVAALAGGKIELHDARGATQGDWSL